MAKKVVKDEGDGYTNCGFCCRKSLQSLEKKLIKQKIKGKIGNLQTAVVLKSAWILKITQET